MEHTIVVLGLDPSMQNTGFALIALDADNNFTILAWPATAAENAPFVPCCGVLNLASCKGSAEFSRLLTYCQSVFPLRGLGKFLGMALEYNPFNNASHSPNEATGQKIRRGQSGASGVIRGFAIVYGIKTLPRVVGSSGKKALTGKGNCTKDESIRAAYMRFRVTAGEHAADGMCIAIAALKREYADHQKKAAAKLAKKAAKSLVNGSDTNSPVSSPKTAPTRRRAIKKGNGAEGVRDV